MVKLASLIEAGAMSFEKVALMTAPTRTPTAFCAGSVETTVGRASAVVKLQL